MCLTMSSIFTFNALALRALYFAVPVRGEQFSVHAAFRWCKLCVHIINKEDAWVDQHVSAQKMALVTHFPF